MAGTENGGIDPEIREGRAVLDKKFMRAGRQAKAATDVRLSAGGVYGEQSVKAEFTRRARRDGATCKSHRTKIFAVIVHINQAARKNRNVRADALVIRKPAYFARVSTVAIQGQAAPESSD